ncbi:Importin subunit beta-1 [Diplonema papillatum]|nr:Importin subunit beta-1 [Diplonema papillatum]
MQERNIERYLGSLMQELSDESKPEASRQLAGSLLKNTMVSRDAVKRAAIGPTVPQFAKRRLKIGPGKEGGEVGKSNAGKMSLTQILLEAQSSDSAMRERAQAQIDAAQNGNIEQYLGSLMQELSDESKPEASRQLAGSLLKNTMVSRDAVKRAAIGPTVPQFAKRRLK